MRAGKVVSIKRTTPGAGREGRYTIVGVVTFAKRPPGERQVRVKRLERVRNDR
jgi:hypothetical protein